MSTTQSAMAGYAIQTASLKQRAEAASSPDATAETLTILANDPRVQVRRRVASNLNTPQTVLVQLGADSDKGVRERAAYNRLGHTCRHALRANR